MSALPARRLTAALLRHFDAHRRDLPWRRTTDPYAVWVSEVMLQQTRVDTVRRYYERWMERFPTVHALAAADLDDVLLAWKGMGYYARARNLHAAARMIRERFNGELPADLTGLRALPGVGEYTAGAVASIAYGVPMPAVDGNVRRVLARLHDLPSPGAARLRRLAGELVPAERPGDFNQALMELGAMICTPVAPACGACPLARWCRARALGVQESRPRPRKAAPVPERTLEVAVLVRGEGRVLVVKRPGTGLLAGLWEFPAPTEHDDVARLVETAEPLGALDPVPHVFTHLKVTYLPRLYRVDDGDGVGAGAGTPLQLVGDRASREVESPGVAWVRWHELEGFALPAAQQRIARAARAAWEAVEFGAR